MTGITRIAKSYRNIISCSLLFPLSLFRHKDISNIKTDLFDRNNRNCQELQEYLDLSCFSCLFLDIRTICCVCTTKILMSQSRTSRCQKASQARNLCYPIFCTLIRRIETSFKDYCRQIKRNNDYFAKNYFFC